MPPRLTRCDFAKISSAFGLSATAIDASAQAASATPKDAVSRRAEREFPSGFQWGTATSAYQIEGAVNEDGRGPLIWDTFSQSPGRIAGNANADVANNHYHRSPDDVRLMRSLGVSTLSVLDRLAAGLSSRQRPA